MFGPQDLIKTSPGVWGYGPYRLFGDSHVVYMCHKHVDVFEINYLVTYSTYNLFSHLSKVQSVLLDDKPLLFMLGYPTTSYKNPEEYTDRWVDLIDAACVPPIETLRGLKDKGLRVVVLSPPPTGLPIYGVANYRGLPGYLFKVGGFDVWRDISSLLVERMREVCGNADVPFVDVYHMLVNPETGTARDEFAWGDGWHCNEVAGGFLAAKIRSAIPLT